jgi:hypothetical protein
MQLEQVVTQAHDCPFGGGLGEPEQTESSGAHGLFDLAEDRLDDHLATRVDRSARRGSDLLMHLPASFLRSRHRQPP